MISAEKMEHKTKGNTVPFKDLAPTTQFNSKQKGTT